MAMGLTEVNLTGNMRNNQTMVYLIDVTPGPPPIKKTIMSGACINIGRSS